MTEPKHTPGPWLRDRTAGLGCDVRAASGKKIALCFGIATPRKRKGEAIEAYRERYERYRAQCDVDAVLIAAAPDLLNALVGAANYIDKLGGISESYRIEIAKASEPS